MNTLNSLLSKYPKAHDIVKCCQVKLMYIYLKTVTCKCSIHVYYRAVTCTYSNILRTVTCSLHAASISEQSHVAYMFVLQMYGFSVRPSVGDIMCPSF